MAANAARIFTLLDGLDLAGGIARCNLPHALRGEGFDEDELENLVRFGAAVWTPNEMDPGNRSVDLLELTEEASTLGFERWLLRLAERVTVNCAICDGRGYVLDQTYGEARIPAGFVPVQACDTCDVLPNDWWAATLADLRQGTVSVRWCPPEPDDDETLHGDWAIVVPS